MSQFIYFSQLRIKWNASSAKNKTRTPAAERIPTVMWIMFLALIGISFREDNFVVEKKARAITITWSERECEAWPHLVFPAAAGPTVERAKESETVSTNNSKSPAWSLCGGSAAATWKVSKWENDGYSYMHIKWYTCTSWMCISGLSMTKVITVDKRTLWIWMYLKCGFLFLLYPLNPKPRKIQMFFLFF